MEKDIINIITIDVTDNENNTVYVNLILVKNETDCNVFESEAEALLLKISINSELTIAHVLEKDDRIVDETGDIELRVLDVAYEEKLKSIERIETGFDIVDESENEDSSINPYDPKLIRVDPKNFSVRMVIDMINCQEIDLSPDFQRRFVWNDITRKSRLIESLLLRIPIPVFYFAQDNQGLFQVVDGVQRLSVLRSFLNNEFKLKNLEYLHECEGKWFKNAKYPDDNLDGIYTRRIEQTQLYINIIDPQTPNKVKFDIFRRINTGGKELNNQEIRNCLANSKTRELIKDLAKSDSFRKATRGSIKPTRMADEELVLRFIAFYLIDNGKSTIKEYKGGMDILLDTTIDVLNKCDVNICMDIRRAFFNAMENAYYIFGDKSFRKASYINKSLFLGISRVLCQYSSDEILAKDREKIKNELNNALEKDGKLWGPVSMATNDAKNISYVYEFIKDLMEN